MMVRPQELAAAGARLAGELATLHGLGQAHGAVDAEHAVLAPPDAVELKASVPAGHGTPDGDVGAFGRLLLDAMGSGDSFASLRLALTAPERTGWRRFLPFGPAVPPAAALRELAVEAAAATAAGPTAADLSTRLSRLAGGDRAPARQWVPKRVAGAGGLALLGAAAVLAWSTVRPTGGDEPPVRMGRPPTPAAAEPTVVKTPALPATRLWPSPPPGRTCPGAGAQSADVDGDGCPDPVEVLEGVIRSGSRRWAVGSGGDIIVLGDWNCDHTTTPAVLRPGTGGLFVFDRWASEAQPQPARPVRVVPGAVGLEPRGCGHAAVRLSDRSVVVVDTGGPR